MKPINRIFRTLAIVATGWATLSLAACSNDDTGAKIDLRYDTEDEYVVTCDKPEAVTIRVRSLYTPWEVKGTGESWYTITPSHGEAGETVVVTIQCKENPELDDREDTISIVSDYWTGKQFRLLQKGTAFLEFDKKAFEQVDGDDTNYMAQDGATYDVPILFNQNWRAEVTEGAEWMTITAGDSGKADNVAAQSTMTVKTVRNNSEQRPGIITLYNRYDQPTTLMEVTQRGYILKPIYPEDPMPDEGRVSWIRDMEGGAHTFAIEVESNAPWKVEKANDEDDWFSFAQTAYDGNSTLEIIMQANNTTRARAAEIVLTTTVPEADAIPVVKNVKVKQANVQVPEVLRSEYAINGEARLTAPIKCGRYDITATGANGKDMRFYFFYPTYPFGTNGARELRYWLNRADGKTDDQVPIMSTMPWVNNPFNPDACSTYSKSENPGYFAKVDKGKTHTYSIDFRKVVVVDEETGVESVLVNIVWLLDGEILRNGPNLNQNVGILRSDTGNWQMTYAQMNTDEASYLQGYGSFTVESLTYTAPVDWGSAD